MRATSFIFFVVCGIVGLIFEDSAYQFFLFQFCVLFFTLWVGLFLTFRSILSNVALIVLSVHSFDVISLLNYMVGAENDTIYNNVYTLHLYDYVSWVAMVGFVPPLVVLASSLFLVKPRPTVFQFLQSVYTPTKPLLYFTLFISLIIIAHNGFYLFGRIPAIVYVVAIIHAAFNLLTFWVGYWNKRLGWVFPVALFSILVDGVVSVLSGGRFVFFLHIVLYFLGYVASQPMQRRKWLVAWAIVLAPFMLTLVGVMGVVRDRIGRGDEALRAEGRVELYLGAFKEVVSGESGISDERIDQLAKGRNINWPNLSAIALTPAVIPYVGFANISNEVDAIFTIEGLSGGTDLENITQARVNQIEKGLGSGMANRYGFMVNEGNSVEWGLLADAWSKGGLWMYLALFSLLFFTFLTIEKIISRRSLFERVVYTMVLVRVVWLVSNSQPVYHTIRVLLLYFSMTFLIVQTFKLFSRKI
jgi:hypothetical protein